jgi:predicted dienelactone hydrolase
MKRILLPILLGLAHTTHAALSDAPGPFAVETVASVKLQDSKRDKHLDTLVRLPKGEGKCPLIVFSHGFGASKEAFAPVSEHWASHGFVVIHPQHADAGRFSRSPGGEGADDEDRRARLREMLMKERTSSGGFNSPDAAANRVADVVAILDHLDDLEKAVPALAGRIDRERIGMAGHSFGAATSLLIAGAPTSASGVEKSLADPRIRCVLPISPSGAGEYGFTDASFGHLKMPMLCITGTRDFRPGRPIEWRREAYDKSPPGGKYLLILDGANHMSFGGGPPGMAARFNNGPAADYTKAVKTASATFFQAMLKADADARASLTVEQVQALPKVKSFELRHGKNEPPTNP